MNLYKYPRSFAIVKTDATNLYTLPARFTLDKTDT